MKSNDAKLVTLSQVAYTFDAGPNACIYLLEKEVPKFLSFLNIIYPNDELPPQEYIRGIPVELKTLKETVNSRKTKRITFHWVFIMILTFAGTECFRSKHSIRTQRFQIYYSHENRRRSKSS